MRKIILIDLDCNVVHSVIRSNVLQIDTLIVSSKSDVINIQEKYNIPIVLSWYEVNEYYTKQNIKLDYSIIENFRNTQLKVEHFFSRVTSDLNSQQYLYYCALSFWIDRFKNEKIDAVFSSTLEFGGLFDSVIFDVAKYYNKRVFLLETSLYNGNIVSNSILNYAEKKYIKVDFKKYNLKKINIKDFLFNSKLIPDKKPAKKVRFKEIVLKVLEKIGGFLLPTFILYIMGKYKVTHHSFFIDWWEYFNGFLFSKKIYSYYNSLCIDFDPSQKYVYYSLHMEPEAATLTRTTFANQLVVIKTISQNLPNGWKLYVKEHPHQHQNLNNKTTYYFLATLHKFKTKRFYDEIKNLSNTYLIKSNISSRLLLENSIAASSISGTIFFESLIMKKPFIAFSQNTSALTKVNGVFDIKNDDDCKKALEILKNGYQPDYDNLDLIIENYYYEVENNQNNNFDLLFEDLLK